MKKIILLFIFLGNFTFAFSQDAKVDEIKANVLKAMGGMKNYQKTNIIQWTFFGSRTHIWDKKNEMVRIEYLKENSTILLNLKDKSGKVFKKGKEVMGADSLKMLLTEAYNTWINDSYWLVMPYKLGDPGVNLLYIGEQNTADGKSADVLEMTFNKVGVTPENKYHIFFDKETKLVSQWSFFQAAKDVKPRFTMPWKDYKKQGKILLSGSRGDRSLDNIAVYETIDPIAFTSFEKPVLIKK
jgi:hypothetical protein